MAKLNPLALGEKKRPTAAHRPGIWECMLGTVYASDGKTTRYFDFDYASAFKFALGDSSGKDLRTFPTDKVMAVGNRTIGRGQLVLWVVDEGSK